MKAVLNGPQGRTTLESTGLTIGSSPDNLLVIDNVKVSAHHAEIRPEEQGYSITDLGSIHGTYVNGERLDFSTPHMLNRGNSIIIGDTTFTYEVEDAPQIEPVPSATSDREGGSGTLHSDDETLPSLNMNSVGVVGTSAESQQSTTPQPEYTLPQQYMPQSPQEPSSQPITVYAGTTPGYVGAIPGYVSVLQVRRRYRLLIGIGLGLLAVIALAVGGYIFFTRSTPEKTLDTYCNALLGQDYLTAYNQLSSTLQISESESQFANVLDAQGKVTTCTHGSANINGATALVSLNFASISGEKSNSPVTLIQDSGNTWKISIPFPASFTLMTYCHALINKDYQVAYDQFASSVKSLLSETDYETSERQSDSLVGGISDCTISNVKESGSSAIGTISLVAGNGQSGDFHYTLTNEGGIWKISGRQ